MAVLGKLSLPAVKQIRGDPELIAEIGNRHLLQQVPLDRGQLILRREKTTLRVLRLVHAKPPYRLF
jgi:hypothetical protein